MLTWLLRLLVVFLLLRLAWQVVRRLAAGTRAGDGRFERRGALVRDPVCGTFVVPSSALSARRGGAVHYFCSDRCRQAFLASATGRLARR